MPELPVAYHNRHSIRLKGYDYTQAGAYFITILASHRDCLFGQIANNLVQLNPFGKLVEKEWIRLAQRFSAVELDEFVVMPNHLHGILFLVHEDQEAKDPNFRTAERFGTPVRGSIPTVVRSFKSTVTQAYQRLAGDPAAKVWQRSYFEHVIRGEDDLDTIRKYIQDNPMKWALDQENPAR